MSRESDLPQRAEQLPCVISTALAEYLREEHPVQRLWRLCEAAEVVTKFCAMIALAEILAGRPDRRLPTGLRQTLWPRIERPTFGNWRAMLGDLIAHPLSGEPRVVPELPEFVREVLQPRLRGSDADTHDTCLIALRNLLAHGGGMSAAAARELLLTWEGWVERLVHGLEFLASGTLAYADEKGAHRLETTGLGEVVAPLGGGGPAPAGRPGRVILVRAGRWLDLWPVCDYGQPAMPFADGLRQGATAVPQVYSRAEPNRLVYAAVTGDLPLGERRDAVREFYALFRGERPPAPWTDFEAELAADAAAVGGTRRAELREVRDRLRASGPGVFWLGGPGGVGKSFFLARLARDLRGDPRRELRIAWRFRTGDALRCNAIAFLRHTVTSLAAWLGDHVEPAADAARLEDQFRQLLRNAARRAGDDRGRRRVYLVVDGLDEIARIDPAFCEFPFRPTEADGLDVFWVCAGREEGGLSHAFRPDRCTRLFPDGLPPMGEADVRAMLLDGTGRLKYELLARDADPGEPGLGGAVENPAVRAVVARAGGLPLYVHFVVQDILAGRFRFADLERSLPPGLEAYYDEQLRRVQIGDIQATLTPMLTTLAWARDPLDEDTLHLLLVWRHALVDGESGRSTLRDALAVIRWMVRAAPVPGTERTGYEPYHLTFREHIREDRAGVLGSSPV